MACLLGGIGSQDQGKVQAKNRVDCNRKGMTLRSGQLQFETVLMLGTHYFNSSESQQRLGVGGDRSKG